MLDLVNVLLGNKQERNHWKQAVIQGSLFSHQKRHHSGMV